MSAIQTEVFDDTDELARSVAERVVELVRQSVNERGRCIIALAGGSTPRRLYELLTEDEFREKIDWEHVHLFLGDERYVPADHEDSNYRMAREALIVHVPVPEDQVHAVATDKEPDEAARSYEESIRETFGPAADGTPAFDLVLLGIGGDGHTASLFPGTGALDVEDRLVAENWVPQQDTMRITFTVPLLQEARNTIVMAAGEDKAEAVARAVEGAPNLEETPSQCLRDARGEVTFALDRGAAAHLSEAEQADEG